MKKTVSVNIKGMNFLIEEDAYELLQSYMNRLTHSLRNEKGSKEIIEDIEFRVAELCSNHLNEKKQVIEKEDIEDITKTLGEPEEYVDSNEEFIQETETNNYEQKHFNTSNRRLYREMEHAKIAGVCGGIANYFNIDVVIIRAIFLIVFFFFGFGFPIYILLWIILPKASTTIDRLKMQGKPITAETIKSEVENASNRLRDETNSFAAKLRKDGSITQRINSIGRFIKLVLGLGAILTGLSILGFFIMLIFGSSIIPFGSDDQFMSLSDIGHVVLEGNEDVFWAWTGVSISCLSAVFFLFILGSTLIFNFKNKLTKISLISLILIGFIGIIISSYIGVKSGREMAFEGELENSIGSIDTDTLKIESHFEKLNGSNIKSNGNSGFVTIEGNRITDSGIHFEYTESKDSLYHIYQVLTANSSSHKKAEKKANNIQHSVLISKNTLHVNTCFYYPKSDKLRDQEVTIVIQIPKGKFVEIDNQKIRMEFTTRDINININGLDDLDELEKLEMLDEDFDEERSLKEGKLEADGEYNSWN